MTTLYLMVGVPCSGKTTRARQLENELSALRLTSNEWHVNLFGHDILTPEHDDRRSPIKSLLWQVAIRGLSLGINIILDFGSSRDQTRMISCPEGTLERNPPTKKRRLGEPPLQI
ncbi:MAG: AAA family ATPase [Bacteroidota bacterium]